MKKAFFILLLACHIGVVFSQENKSQFLLPDFQEGTVYYKDGRRFNMPLNYNVAAKKFFFSNKTGEYLKFAEPDMVSLVKIGERTFIHDKKRIQEVLQTTPPILVEYRGVLKNQSTPGSAVGAVKNMSGVMAGGRYHQLDPQKEVATFSRLIKKYQIVYNRKKVTFTNAGSFLKIYPPPLREKLKNYIKENNIDFNSSENVVQLCNYASSL